MSLEQIARAQQAWNRPDADGKSIEPPIAADEAESFLRYGVHPEAVVKFEFLHPLSEDDQLQIWTAQAVLIACRGIRNPEIPGYNPDLVARELMKACSRAIEDQ